MAWTSWQNEDDQGNTVYGATNNGYTGGEDNNQATANAMKAGGSGLSALAGALLANRAIQKGKKIASIKREMVRKNYLDQMNSSLMNEGEGDIAYGRGVRDMNSQLGAAGLGESSAKDVANRDAQHTQDLRVWALQKQRANLKYGYEKGAEIDKLQRQMERIQQQNAMITAAIDTASSAASMAVMCDKNVKRDFEDVDKQDVLTALMALPIKTWRYEWEEEGVRHLGPMAQDWHEKLGFGNHHDGKKIDIVDAFGVAIMAVQALTELVTSQNARIRKLEGKKK